HAGYQECEEAFRGLDYWAWQDAEGGERFCGAHSHTWDTSFAVQAICAGPASETASHFLSGAASYLKQAQIQQEVPQRQRFYQDIRRGGFCFSDERHQWPVSDCTAEALRAVERHASACSGRCPWSGRIHSKCSPTAGSNTATSNAPAVVCTGCAVRLSVFRRSFPSKSKPRFAQPCAGGSHGCGRNNGP